MALPTHLHLKPRLKKEYSYTSTPPSGSSWPVIGWTLLYFTTFGSLFFVETAVTGAFRHDLSVKRGPTLVPFEARSYLDKRFSDHWIGRGGLIGVISEAA